MLPRILLTRNLLYTAITRAKKMVILIGSDSVMKYMVGNEGENKRYSKLNDWIDIFFENG